MPSARRPRSRNPTARIQLGESVLYMATVAACPEAVGGLHWARMKRIVMLAALFLSAAFSAVAQLNGVTAELLTGQGEYLPGEAVDLKVRVLNRSGQEIVLGADNNWVTISIVSENNDVCPKLGDMPVAGQFSLQSGEMGTRTFNPTPYFDFHTQGRYKVTGRIRLPQWNEEIVCKTTAFTVADGVPLPGLANLQFGLPPAPGASNTAPEVRTYSLLKTTYLKDLKLYFRLTESTGRVLKVFPIATMTSFSVPEAQIDRFNNLHVLSQIGAKAFIYCVLNPDGHWIARQTYVYTDRRPELRVTDDGQIFVLGGAREISASDYPAPQPEAARQN